MPESMLRGILAELGYTEEDLKDDEKLEKFRDRVHEERERMQIELSTMELNAKKARK